MPGPKILGQHPTGTSASTTLYTSPANGAGTVVSTIALVSATGASGTGKVRVVPSGATESDRHTLVPTTTVAPGELIPVTIGVTLAAGDKITAVATGGAGVHVYGTEL